MQCAGEDLVEFEHMLGVCIGDGQMKFLSSARSCFATSAFTRSSFCRKGGGEEGEEEDGGQEEG